MAQAAITGNARIFTPKIERRLMIDRLVFVRLKEEYRTESILAEIATHSEGVLRSIPQVRDIRAVTAADEQTRQDWDLLLAIRLDDVASLAPFRTDPTHRDYVDNYLKAKIEKIKGWNFAS